MGGDSQFSRVGRFDRCVDKYTREEVEIRTLQDLDLSPQLGEACDGLRLASQCSVVPCGPLWVAGRGEPLGEQTHSRKQESNRNDQ